MTVCLVSLFFYVFYFHRNEGADDGGDGVNKVADVQWSHLGLSVHATLPPASLCERDTKSTGTHTGIFSLGSESCAQFSKYV